MSKVFSIVAAVVLILHGVVHFLGTALYLQLTTVDEMPYKTTLLGGRWDLGHTGMRWFEFLWAFAAFGFVFAGIAFLAGWSWWRPWLVGVTSFSMVLTVSDWSNAHAGVVNLLILGALWIAPLIFR